MEKITLEDALTTKLKANGSEVELFDQNGQLCGYFLTPEAYVKMLYALEMAEPVDEEEIEAAMRDYEQNGGLTTAEVLEHLKALDQVQGGPG